MKKEILLLLLCCTIHIHSQNVNIPDANFKAALLANTAININSDGDIQVSEAVGYTGKIRVDGKNISDLTGIEAFRNITGLDCSLNQLTSLNVSQNPALLTLYCGYNLLQTLNISANTVLTELDCGTNKLTNLNVSSNTHLVSLNCGVNMLTSLNVSSNPSFTILGCDNNQLSNLDLSANKALTILVCSNNKLSSLSVSANTALYSIDCGGNLITSLNLNTNATLVSLACYNNQLTQLDISVNTALRYLSCQQNKLNNLDVSKNTSLQAIGCSYNLLKSLNVKNGNNTHLTSFLAINNPELTCIQVDDAAYMNANWANGKDATAIYSANCSITGIAETENGSEWIAFYPNPANDLIEVRLMGFSKNISLKILNLSGETILNELKTDHEKLSVDISSLHAGIYIAEIEDSEKISRIKFVKM